MIQPLQLLAIGEVMAEIRRDDSAGFHVGFAGDTYNTAIYANRMLDGEVAYFTRIGADPLSSGLLRIASDEGLNTDHIATDRDHPIGIYAVATDETGERSFSYWRDTSAARQLFSHDEAVHAMPLARITYLSGITLAIISAPARQRLMDHLRKASKDGKTLVAFDSNYRPKLWESAQTARTIMGEMWEIADIALPSIDDEMALFGDTSEEDVTKRFAKRPWKACAIKRGIRGPLSLTQTHDQMPAFAPAENVADTTAAGDSFNAGYLAAYLEGRSEPDCLLAGHVLASKVVGHSGAIVPLEAFVA